MLGQLTAVHKASPALTCSGGRRHPRRIGSGTKLAEGGSADQMSLGVEGVRTRPNDLVIVLVKIPGTGQHTQVPGMLRMNKLVGARKLDRGFMIG